MSGYTYLFIVSIIILIIGIVLIANEKSLGILIVLIGIIATIIFLGVSIGLPEQANREIKNYQNKQNNYVLYCEFLNNQNNYNYENEELIYYYISEIREYNEWLKKAKDSQDNQGCFSAYYGKDLSKFDYIYLYI